MLQEEEPEILGKGQRLGAREYLEIFFNHYTLMATAGSPSSSSKTYLKKWPI